MTPRPGRGLWILLIVVAVAHLPLLSIPYFWDEAGYYVIAAEDLASSGALVPVSVPSSGHPPLLSAYVWCVWSLFGKSIPVTRTAMLLLSGLGIWAVYRLAQALAKPDLALPAAICSAAYPVVFAQSTMVLPDLPSAALSLLGLGFYFRRRMTAAVVLFTLAVLMKETAILIPVVLFVFDLRGRRRAWWMGAPVLALVCWYFYHWVHTGFLLGSQSFFRYNLAGNLDPGRFAMAFAIRCWQVFGHMGMLVPTLAGIAGLVLAFDRFRSCEWKWRITVLVGTHIVALSVLGGAALARYLLPVFPLVLLGVLAVWPWPRLLTAATLAAFVSALLVNPPYHFAPEENLAYRDFARLHQDAAQVLERDFRDRSIATVWPATMELTRPTLGYVKTPLRVTGLPQRPPHEVKQGEVVFAFTSEYVPPDGALRPGTLLNRFGIWRNRATRYFSSADSADPGNIAAQLHGRVWWQGRRGPFRAAIVVRPD